MQRTIEVDLDGTFRVLNNLVIAEQLETSEAPWMISGFSLRIFSPRTNAAGTRVQLTSDFVNLLPDREILVEAAEEYGGGGAIHNSVSLLDKLIRIVDGADLATTGTAIVTFTWA